MQRRWKRREPTPPPPQSHAFVDPTYAEPLLQLETCTHPQMAGGHFAAAECAVQCSSWRGAEDVVGGFRIATSRAKEYGIGVPILNFLDSVFGLFFVAVPRTDNLL